MAAGKHPKYISTQAGHGSAGFTLDRYAHLLEETTPKPVEWIDDLIGGWDQISPLLHDNENCEALKASAVRD